VPHLTSKSNTKNKTTLLCNYPAFQQYVAVIPATPCEPFTPLSLTTQGLAYLSDTSSHRRNFVKSEWAAAVSSRGVTRGSRGAQFPGRQFTMGALNHCKGAELLLEAPKRPNNVTSTFLYTVNLPSKELRFDHRDAKLRPWGRRSDQGGAEFVFCPGRHATSLRPWFQVIC